ncbi:hypothetical protein [Streptomyces sp. NPDC005438]|uniref:hypothetical protein n=1 Tax=Streptomyces sp. NPDC005438 TaxID=3156880 RepID=UPI0033BD677B
MPTPPRATGPRDLLRRHGTSLRIAAWLAATVCWVAAYVTHEPLLYLPLGVVAVATLLATALRRRD